MRTRDVDHNIREIKHNEAPALLSKSVGPQKVDTLFITLYLSNQDYSYS